MRVLALLALSLLLASGASAQGPTPSDCDTGSAEVDLNGNEVRATLYNIGGLFWRGSNAQYEVPAGTGLVSLFAMGLWVSGTVEGDLRFAGSTYGPWEFWPGPLDASGETTPGTCQAFDRFWKVSKADVETYDATGVATSNLERWPIAYGASFYTDADGDGRQGASEPTVSLNLGDPGYGSREIDLPAGERPVLFGDQTIWWVLNDVGNDHDWGGTAPLGIEVQVTAWVPSPTAFRQSTAYRYTIINRSGTTLRDGRAGFFVDGDLGNFNDDYVHADSSRSMLVFYNGDADDDGAGGYGLPPALGIDLLSGASGAMYQINNASQQGDPGTATEAVQYLNGRWLDGSPLQRGGSGYRSGGPEVRWPFSDDPATLAFWTEEDTDAAGTRSTPGDRRGTLTAEPFELAPGARVTLDLSILFAHGDSRLLSVAILKALSDDAQAAYASGALFDNTDLPPPSPLAAPTLVSPDDGAAFSEGPVRFEWGPVDGAVAYTLLISESADLSAPILTESTAETSATLPANALPTNREEPLFWSVRAVDARGSGPATPARSFVYLRRVAGFTSFAVVANASGPIAPHSAAASFQGFPTPGDQAPDEFIQQTTGARWLIAAGAEAFDGSYASFLEAVLRNDNAARVGGRDFEARFTGTSQAYRLYQDFALVEIPFEIWTTGVGTPDDPSDDVRLVPVIRDYGSNRTDPNGVYDLSTRDSPVSNSADDPETDWIYWHEPLDMTPGETGYLAWAAGAATDPTAHGPELLARTVFVGWNFGASPPYSVDLPEPGTVFRMVSTVLPTASTDDAPQAPALSVAVAPNPLRQRAEVTVRLASAGEARLSVRDVLGREVAVLAEGPLAAGRHTAALDASALAAGIYLVVLDAADQRVVRTMTVTR